MAISKSWL